MQVNWLQRVLVYGLAPPAQTTTTASQAATKPPANDDFTVSGSSVPVLIDASLGGSKVGAALSANAVGRLSSEVQRLKTQLRDLSAVLERRDLEMQLALAQGAGLRAELEAERGQHSQGGGTESVAAPEVSVVCAPNVRTFITSSNGLFAAVVHRRLRVRAPS